MIRVSKYVKECLTSQFLGLVLGIFLLFPSNISTNKYILLVEKTAENKKEETRTEKETEDEKGGEQNQFGKSKKVKRQQTPPPPPDLSECLVSTFSSLVPSPKCIVKNDFLVDFSQKIDLFSHSPRYLRFHSLVFYES